MQTIFGDLNYASRRIRDYVSLRHALNSTNQVSNLLFNVAILSLCVPLEFSFPSAAFSRFNYELL
jgi:hypothetical protein